MSRLRYFLSWLDGRPDRVFLGVDLALGLFIGLAHGGALMVERLGKAPQYASFVPALIASLACALYLVVSGAVALLSPGIRSQVLKTQAALLSIYSLFGMALSAYWVCFGLPATGFGWTPGFLSAFCAYPAYLLRRCFAVKSSSKSSMLADLPIWVGVAAVLLDLGLGVRTLVAVTRFFNEHS